MKNPFLAGARPVLALLCVLAGTIANATNIYFSTSDGDDARTAQQAQNPATPWRSVAKLNAVFSSLQPGDAVYFKRGDVFAGTINITASGTVQSPISLLAYGTGAKPVVTGFTTFDNWSNLSGNIWEADAAMAGADMNIVVINGQVVPVGRYPNSTAANGGYLTVDSYSGNTSITSNQLNGGTNWTGADVVIRKTRWVLDKNKVTGQAGSNLNYTSESGYNATSQYGYFLQNHPSTLDQNGEWYYQNKKLGLYYSNGPVHSATVQGSVLSALVQLNNQNNISFSDLTFTGANNNALEIHNAQNISFTGCGVSYSGINAFNVNNTGGLKIEGTTIDFTNNVAMNIDNCWDAVIRGNTISNTGTIAGMGKGNSGSYEGILLSGNNDLVEANTILNTGYIPITFNGSGITVKNNFINHYTLVKDDGGGIYTWNNSSNAPNYTGRKITGNIILNGTAANAGTNESSAKFSHGIYLDDNSANVEVDGNTVANCEGFGVYVHNAHENTIKNNTLYNNTVQLEVVHDDIAPALIRNLSVTNNIFFSLSASQLVAEYKTNGDDLADFGTFDNNYYNRPLDDNALIGVLKRVNGNYSYQQTDVEGWKAMYGKDANSKPSAKTYLPYNVTGVLSGNKFWNGAFNANTGGLYAYAGANNCQTSWANSVLDGGALAVSFSSITNSSKGTVIIGVGALVAGKKYTLKFSLKGSNENKMLDVYLRKSQAPYNDVTDRQKVKIKAARKEIEVLFTATETTADGSIGIDVLEQTTPVYFDNIELKEVAATPINITDSVTFYYNASAVSTVQGLSAAAIDARSAAYSGSVALPAFSSAVLMTTTPVTIVPNVTCSGTGSILREQWDGISGNDIVSLSTAPTSTSQLTAFEAPQNSGDNYGSRISGYICAPQTGNYTFWIAGDDATELWLSTTDNAAGKVKIAYNLSWTNFREWTRFASQKSATIYLEAGKKYYIEALHKEGGGGDHLSVMWQLPDGSSEAPIQGSHLSPAQATAVKLNQTITFNALQNVTLSTAVNLSATATSNLPVTFTVVSGAATISNGIVTPSAAGTVLIKATQPGDAQYNAAPDVQQQLTVNAAAVICSGTGSILREQWNGIGGNDLAVSQFINTPSLSSQLTSFEGPQNTADNYASRIRGYVCAPQTGNYTFFIAGDDATELWMSTDANAAGKVKIAYSQSWTGFREWTRFASQKSATIYLEAGKKYYIEALQKEGGGGDHLSVMWQLPDGSSEAPIQGSHLSPFVPASLTSQTISFSTLANFTLGNAPLSLTATATSGLPVSFSVVSGSATVTGNLLVPTGTGTILIKASQAGNAAFAAAADVLQSIVVVAPATCSATGSILREVWNNIGGNDVANLNVNKAVSSSSQLTAFEAPQNSGDNYGSRISGYICAPQTGNYTFWIAGDDATELWLSTTDNAAGKVKIAYNLSWTNFREWTRFASQKSATIYLEAGKKYYIEALHKEGGGGDHLSVMWQLPDGSSEAPIQGSHLSPVTSGVANSADAEGANTEAKAHRNVNALKWVVVNSRPLLTVFPNPFAGQTTIEVTPTESGSATVAVFNSAGSIAARIYSGKVDKGITQQFTFNADRLSAGMYYIRFTSADKTINLKVIRFN